jgi:acyl-coenzyme A synthetase/AMP-(fatty) acid ligase
MFSLAKLGQVADVRRGLVWSPDELRQQIAGSRRSLQRAGVARYDKVVIAHGGTPEFFADLFAAWSLGACCVCVNASLTRGELVTVVDFVEPAAVLVTPDGAIPTEGLQVPVIDTREGGLQAADMPDSLLLAADDPALILFTSGTTGNPKGVVHTGGSLAARLQHNREHISAASLARSLCILPTHFGHGLIGNCLTPLTASSQLYLFPTPGIQGTAQIGDILVDNQITFISSVPAFWKIATRVVASPAQQTLQQVNIGSAPLSAELWQSVIDWSGTDNVNNMYGITETANWAAGISAKMSAPEDGLVGYMWGGEAAVLDDDKRLQKSGEGELVLHTPSLMAGYYQRDDLTAEVMRDGWYYSGDRGSIDASGCIRMQGRLKSEINRAGTKVLPEEVDLLLERHAAVAEACTFGVPDPINGEMVAVAVRLADNEAAPADLKAWCAERIRIDCVPEKWFVLPEIPKTDRGKINRDRVRDVCLKPKA